MKNTKFQLNTSKIIPTDKNILGHGVRIYHSIKSLIGVMAAFCSAAERYRFLVLCLTDKEPMLTLLF